MPEAIRAATAVLRKGGVIVFPTTGLYGLGADAFNDRAVEKIYEIKARSPNKPIPVVIKDAAALAQMVTHVPEPARRIIKGCWPGRVTIVFEALSHISDRLTAGTGKIGVRQPRHFVAANLVASFQNPVTATSANISGRLGISHISDLDASIRSSVDLILDAGELEGGVGSTICDVTTVPPTLLREGAVDAQEFLKSLKITVRKIIDNPC